MRINSHALLAVAHYSSARDSEVRKARIVSIRKNTLWNLAGSMAPMLGGVVAIPYLLHRLGVGRLGVLTLIWSLIGYFSVFDFGLGRALTYKVSALIAAGRTDRALGSIKAGLLLLAGVGCVGAILVTACVIVFGVGWLNIDPHIYRETYFAILISSAAIPVTTLTSGLKGVLEGFQDFRIVNILRAILGLMNFAIPVATVAVLGPNLSFVVGGLLVSRLIVMILHFAALGILLRPIRHAPVDEPDDSREITRFGAWMTASNVIGPMMTMADRFVISHFIGGATVAYYTVPSDFLSRLAIIPSALTTTLFPIFAGKHLSGESRTKAFRDFYFKNLRVIAAVMLPIVLVICGLSYYGLYYWLGRAFADHAYCVVMVIAFGLLFNSMAQVPYAIIQAAGDVKTTTVVHFAEILVYLPIMIYGVIHIGILGAAFAWQLRMTADFIILHELAMRKYFRLPTG